jgi:hypothetical protein
MEGDEIGTRRLVERFDRYGNPRRRMIAVHHLVRHFGGQEVRVGPLLHQVRARALLIAREFLLGERRVEEHTGGNAHDADEMLRQ